MGASIALFSSCDDECENQRGECPDEQLVRDVNKIEEYLEKNNLTAEKDQSYDFFYIIHEEGSGDTPNNGQTVEVNYTGKFLNDEIFDTSLESVAKDADIFNENRDYGPFSFTIGGNVIKGWNVGFKLFNKGTKATLLLPSYMAYGPRGNPPTIPANEVLIFEVELINIE